MRLPLFDRVHGVNSALVEVVLGDFDFSEFSDAFFRSALDLHFDGQLWSRYLAVNRALGLRVSGVVTRDDSNVEQAAAVVPLVVDIGFVIGLVVDIVVPVGAHAFVSIE